MNREIWEKAVAFHGHECGGLAIGVRVSMEAIKRLNIEPATSYDDFQEKLIKIMYQAEESNSYVIFKELINMDEESPFRKKYSGLFLSNDAPEELKRIFYTKNPSIIALLQNPEWIPYIKNIDLQKLGIKLPINIYLPNNFNLNKKAILSPFCRDAFP